MTEHIRQDDLAGSTWRIEVLNDKSCVDCIVAGAGNDQEYGGAMINRRDKMMTIMNVEIVPSDECEMDGHPDALDLVIATALKEGIARGLIDAVDHNGMVLYQIKAVDNG